MTEEPVMAHEVHGFNISWGNAGSKRLLLLRLTEHLHGGGPEGHFEAHWALEPYIAAQLAYNLLRYALTVPDTPN